MRLRARGVLFIKIKFNASLKSRRARFSSAINIEIDKFVAISCETFRFVRNILLCDLNEKLFLVHTFVIPIIAGKFNKVGT